MYTSVLNFPGHLFDDWDSVRRQFDELFSLNATPSSIRPVTPGTFPAINVGTTPTSVEVYAFAPGLNPDRIEVVLDRGVLSLSGEREAPKQETSTQVQVHARERSTGTFKRTIGLPDDVDPSKVTASYRHGILQVSIARLEVAQPQRIVVQ